jgi:hypothetical protein
LRQFFPVNRESDAGFLLRKPEQVSPAGGIGFDSYREKYEEFIPVYHYLTDRRYIV